LQAEGPVTRTAAEPMANGHYGWILYFEFNIQSWSRVKAKVPIGRSRKELTEQCRRWRGVAEGFRRRRRLLSVCRGSG